MRFQTWHARFLCWRLAQPCCSHHLPGRPARQRRTRPRQWRSRPPNIGQEKAFPEFDAQEGPWHDRDLYVTVQDSKGVMVAHGTNAGLIGKSMLDLKDVDGKPFNREVQAIKDVGWVNFKWQNPLTKAVQAKTAYEVRVGDYIIGVGAYVQ